MVYIEYEEKVKELTSEVERLREKKQVDDNNPSIDISTDDITLGKLIDY